MPLQTKSSLFSPTPRQRRAQGGGRHQPGLNGRLVLDTRRLLAEALDSNAARAVRREVVKLKRRHAELSAAHSPR